ncbi:sporulation histidine kinase inhibitor Sda [Bacillus sp. ISL-46]|nr:sporulation histidine kinase inhibitor Sda [Bacillus sp. ISL-46]MBT2721132.1 sporulation histidine kinase inhibitor Sda [Bacillus sp. ISL-46]
MEKLPDYILIESYYKAKELKLHPDFIRILKTELYQRSLLQIDRIYQN